jgi:peptide/nickel transport system substrate-binding protein
MRPPGGRIVTGEVGSFDSLNPHILQRLGAVAAALSGLRKPDGPVLGRTLHALRAAGRIGRGRPESRCGSEFTLRPEARFSDGSPVTVEDVIWSYETLGTEGTRATSAPGTGRLDRGVGERGVRLHLHRGRPRTGADHGPAPDPEEGAMGGRGFRRKRARRDPDRHQRALRDRRFRGRALRLAEAQSRLLGRATCRSAAGTNNIDEIRMEFFADGTAMFEAFKAGAAEHHAREPTPPNGTTQYDFPRVQAGEVVLSEIPHPAPLGHHRAS